MDFRKPTTYEDLLPLCYRWALAAFQPVVERVSWVSGQAVSVLPEEMLFGTTIWQPGDYGHLVLPREVASNLGLL